jgi:phosphate transport system protein
MERHFETELEKLHHRLMKMAGIVVNQIIGSLKALQECDVEAARSIIEHDRKVDKLDNKIDKLCQRIFALTQPVATDLRFIMSALKINNDLERMGDHAVGIALKIETLAENRDLVSSLDLNDIVLQIGKLMEKMVTILAERSTTHIFDIFDLASEIHDRIEVHSKEIIDEMTRKSEIIVVATNLMLVLTQIDRIVAYTKNIAESMVFVVEGNLVKHAKPVRLNPEITSEPEKDNRENDSFDSPEIKSPPESENL